MLYLSIDTVCTRWAFRWFHPAFIDICANLKCADNEMFQEILETLKEIVPSPHTIYS